MTVAGWLNVTAVGPHGAVAMVVPPATLGPLTPALSKTALQPVTVALIDPAVVVMLSVEVVEAGTIGAFQFETEWPAVGPAVTVAGRLMVKVVPFTMEAIVAPAGMFGPVIDCPTTMPWVVLGTATVTVVLPDVVVTLKVVRTGFCPAGVPKFVRQGGWARTLEDKPRTTANESE